MGGGAYRAAAGAAAALERAARGLAEELQGFERAEVVARDAAPQARRAVVAVRPRPLRLRNDEALARRGVCAWKVGDSDKALRILSEVQAATLPPVLKSGVRDAWADLVPEPRER